MGEPGRGARTGGLPRSWKRSTTQSYFGYLQNTLGVEDPLALRMARHSALDWGSSGTDLMTIAEAKSCGALGFAPVAVYDESSPYIHHFPDGNAGVARALVKKLVPAVASGANAEELVTARFDYSELDKPGNSVRIRLNSTAVDVRHAGSPGSSNRDVESITVNRWAHGYSSSGVGDSVERGRQPFGRIAIANTDSGPGNDVKIAIDMAARAVNELEG